mgnify:CR=1 FL=1
MAASRLIVLSAAKSRQDGEKAGFPAVFFTGVVWRRVIAYGIDVSAIATLMVPLWILALLLGLASFGLLWPVVLPLMALVPLAYHTMTIGGPRSATPGMRAMNLAVRTWDGRRPGYVQAAILTATFYVSVAATAWLILLVALFNRRRRCLHDMLCGTTVVRADLEAAPVVIL